MNEIDVANSHLHGRPESPIKLFVLGWVNQGILARAIVYFFAFFGAAFLAGFLAAFLAGFLAAFLAGFLAFLAAGFLAAFFALGFLTFFALGFLTFLAAFFFLGFLTLGTAPSLNLPAPLPEARAFFRVPLASPLLSPRRTLTAAVLASTLLLATTYFRMAWREEPPRSFNPAIAAAIILLKGGWAAAFLGAFLTSGMVLSC